MGLMGSRESIPCLIDDCPQPPLRRGWCSTHYQRWLKNGDALALRRKPAIERFYEGIDCGGADGCWLWTRATNHGGYPLMSVEGRQVRLHRWSYEHFVGPIPAGLTIDHLCRVPRCVNPLHLEPVTNAENIRRSHKPHCRRGHPFVWNGKRNVCPVCEVVRQQRKADKRKEAA